MEHGTCTCKNLMPDVGRWRNAKNNAGIVAVLNVKFTKLTIQMKTAKRIDDYDIKEGYDSATSNKGISWEQTIVPRVEVWLKL